ncbi:RNB domain-containing ribonuclease [Pontiellaceae bacterium B1224]|nr:RNB domain-containing ribonuclease [Pontiellaceae bacterium B1224]
MSQSFSKQNLVLYKKQPALVEQVADKISIQLASGKQIKVREKDIQFLNKGPVQNLGALEQEPAGNLSEAWELLQGESVPLADLAELIYGDASPASVWHAWLALDAQLYFTGSIDEVVARSEEEVESLLEKQREKEQEAALWDDYLQRVRQRAVEPQDIDALRDIERLAIRKASTNRTLKALGIEITPEKAHRLLLDLNLWHEATNPYPARFDCSATSANGPVPELIDEQREDLTALDTYAIDDENCTDPDDAISLDGASIWVHVADAAALIAPDSPLDHEARARGANLYVPEYISTMLPEAVTHVLGLGLSDPSPALSIQLTLSDAGAPVCQKITPSWVRVKGMSYAEADQLMDQSPFQELQAITAPFRKRRMEIGAAQIDLPEVKLNVKLGQEPVDLALPHDLPLPEPAAYTVEIKPLPSLQSRQMVTDAMLMAGEAIADFLIEHEIPAPFVSQPAPDEATVPETMSDMFAYRKKFKRSRVHLEPELHAGLGLPRYTRATSPLRRYSDLLVHQQLRAFLRGDEILSESDILARVSEADVASGQTAMAERNSNRHWTLLYMKQHSEKVYRGVVVDKQDDRGTVLIPELGIDVKIRKLADASLDQQVAVQLNQINLPDLHFTCRLVTED